MSRWVYFFGVLCVLPLITISGSDISNQVLAQQPDIQQPTMLASPVTSENSEGVYEPVINIGYSIEPSMVVTISQHSIISDSIPYSHSWDPIVLHDDLDSAVDMSVLRRTSTSISQVVEIDSERSILSTDSLTSTGTSYKAFSYSGMDPSDSHIAAGPDNLVVVINSRIAIYDKQSPGTLLYERSLNDWYQGLISMDAMIVDPRVIYDHVNDRFIMVATAINMTTQEAWWAISASQQASAIGPWRLHISDSTVDGTTPTGNFADFPGLGTDGTHLYLTGNMADFAQISFQYAKIRVLELDEVYDGNITKYVDVVNLFNDDGSKASAIQPVHRYATATEMYLINVGTSGNLTLWTILDPFSEITTVTATNVSVPGFDNPPDAEQPDTAVRIETNDTRLLQALMGNDGIWTVQCVAHDWGTGDRSAIRLYEIETDGTALLNQVTFGNSTSYFYYPSLAIDSFGNLLVHFSISSPTLYASMGYTGRRFNDPPNTIEPTIRLVKLGEESYTATPRWGDYSGVAIDPANGHVFWMHNQYAEIGNEWGTWIASATYLDNKVFLPLILQDR
jgi:hypothetical protein